MDGWLSGLVSWGWEEKWMEASINVVRCLTGEIVAMVFSAVGSVSWNERLCACMYRTVTVFNTSLSVADAKCCLLRCQPWMEGEFVECV